MNEVQNVSFDLFKNFISICEKLNLKWFMINGSALGAVKYGGFIPWDDDIDVGLLRKDYEIFLNKAQDLLPKDIFLQNYRTDSLFPFSYSKLRNSNTTFIEEGVKNLKINHGIYIDIFPLDSYPENANMQAVIAKKKRRIFRKIFCVINDKSKLKVRFRNSIFKLLGYGKRTAKSIKQLEDMVTVFGETPLICNHGDRMKGKQILRKEVYGSGTEAYFEGIKVIVPEKIDEYLTHKYGDWRSDPPDIEQKSHHIANVIDINKSYTEFFP